MTGKEGLLFCAHPLTFFSRYIFPIIIFFPSEGIIYITKTQSVKLEKKILESMFGKVS